jgi:N-acetylglucosamine malate deacetylase 2
VYHRPKVVIVAAHLCDIVAAVGGHLDRWQAVAIVHTTKIHEHVEAVREIATLCAVEFVSLGYALQETPAHLMQLTRSVAAIFRRLRPDIVLTHAYEGGDCDRDAAAFAVHHAARDLQKRPILVEMTSWMGTGEVRSLGEFLHKPGVCERISRLTDGEQLRKKVLVALVPELRSRGPEPDLQAERFRMAPVYDFTRPPHSEKVGYEQTGGRWTGESWRTEAARVIPMLHESAAS